MQQRELLSKVIEVLEEMGISYMIVGSYGSGAWGEPRFTQGIDMVVSLTSDDAEPLARAFPLPDYYVSIEALKEAIACGGQFNVIHQGSGNKIDFMMARRDPWGRMQLARRKTIELEEGLKVCVASPEDIILAKMEYYRQGGSEKHLRDITGIVKVRGKDVDFKYIADWAEKLELSEIWRAILRRVEKP
ncbi:MAG TPA: hypothetical protein ENH84_07960 [Phycisphaerae bacterium]|nr:hypothetical protein [Phycisphaerae bacterium]